MDRIEEFARMNKMISAYHEAGHAVVALALGCRVAGVHADGTGGCTTVYHDADDTDRRSLVVLVAGHICDELLHLYEPGREWPPHDYFWDGYNHEYEFVTSQFARDEYDPNGRADVDQAAVLADRVCADAVHAVLVEAERAAAALLVAHWPAVEALAEALTEHPTGRLTGRQVSGLLSGMVPPAPRRWLSAAS